jgi:hypothetical protein
MKYKIRRKNIDKEIGCIKGAIAKLTSFVAAPLLCRK